MEQLQDKAVAELEDATLQKHPGDRNRFPRLLLQLSPLRSLHSETLEDLFFSGLIGNIQIDSVIPYILKMEPKEYQNHLGSQEEQEESSSGSPEPSSPESEGGKRSSDKESEDMDTSSSSLKVEVSVTVPETSDSKWSEEGGHLMMYKTKPIILQLDKNQWYEKALNCQSSYFMTFLLSCKKHYFIRKSLHNDHLSFFLWKF